MNKPPKYPIRRMKNPRDKRLAIEHRRLHELCSAAERMVYICPNNFRAPLPPEVYQITYFLKSIVGLDAREAPIYGCKHQMEIILPAGYPTTAGAQCKMLTPVWHPNIKWEGKYKGRICVNVKEFGANYYIDDLVLRVGSILQYQNYHAKNEQPFPEDPKVAQWVREYAEPRKIVDKERGIFVDGTSLLGPVPECGPDLAGTPSTKEKNSNPSEFASGMKITSVRRSEPAPSGKKIKFSKRRN